MKLSEPGAQVIINDHPIKGEGDGRVRTILAYSTNDLGDVQAYHLRREIRYHGKADWEPLLTADGGVKLRVADILLIASVACKNHSEFTARKASNRRRKGK